ncbi:MAG TPA: hypothetical protein VF600_13070 [Abditibacteriaceae bacterium]|jgi:hypothetical protein
MSTQPLHLAVLLTAAVTFACSVVAQEQLSGPVQVTPIKLPIAKPYKAVINPHGAALQITNADFPNLLKNPQWTQSEDGAPIGWRAWGGGFGLEASAGREKRTAVAVARTASDPERGIVQEVVLDQKTPEPLFLTGWSRAEEVSGSADSNYSLYADVTFMDGTHLWGESAAFNTGTHGWQRVEHIISPEKPIKSVAVYALFRGHTGKAWFSDIELAVMSVKSGVVLFDGVPVRVVAGTTAPEKATVYTTQDGLSLGVVPGSGRVSSLRIGRRELSQRTVPSGFMARDVANGSGFHPFPGGRSPELKLKLDSTVKASADHLAISGRITDLTGQDRAISLAFALPVNASNWQWGQHIRLARRIGTEGGATGSEYSNTVAFDAGANGRHSLYPLANVHDASSGLAVALDMNFAAQNRIALNAATRQFYIVYDFGLTPEKSSAEFRFVLYRTDPQWGFRDAVQKLYRIFPEMFAVRGENRTQGLWMPFTDISQVQGWQDFGFRYREAGNDVATSASDNTLDWDDKHGILTFRYSEPMTWWMSMPPDMPRTYENALTLLQRIAGDAQHAQHSMARAVLSSGFRDESGRYPLVFRNEPWANGAVWSLNVSPGLPGEVTSAKMLWTPKTRDTLYSNNPKGKLDGEYLDSIEGYVTANLNFDRDQLKHSQVPLTFATSTRAPAQHKALAVYEFARDQSRSVHQIGKLMFANSVPYRFSFLTPWLDVMGTEVNWLRDGQWTPDDDALMNLRRTMSGGKPYLFLQNSDFEKFTPVYVEKYMQRSLFYGMFPGFFSLDASTNPYWLNPTWYNRDRALFKKYMPIIKPVAEAGWQPITLATSNNSQVWVERFGPVGRTVYLTLRNNSDTTQLATITLQKPLTKKAALQDMVTNQSVPLQDGNLSVTLQPDQTMSVRLN